MKRLDPAIRKALTRVQTLDSITKGVIMKYPVITGTKTRLEITLGSYPMPTAVWIDGVEFIKAQQ